MRTRTLRFAIFSYQGFLVYLFCANTLAMTEVTDLPLSAWEVSAQGFAIQLTLLAMQFLGFFALSIVNKRQRLRSGQPDPTADFSLMTDPGQTSETN